MMTIIYDDNFQNPVFEEIFLNGKDGAWSLYLDGDDEGDEITFENAKALDEWLAAVVVAGRAAGLTFWQTALEAGD